MVSAGPPTPAEIRYEAESPDEAALVVAAKVFGFFMIKRTNTTITLRERMPNGSADREYDVLNLLEFNSTRKRMSVIVKDRQTGRMVLYCKVGLSGMHPAQANELPSCHTRSNPAERRCASAFADIAASASD
jgi:magnesium-transporting ATPase (P-type)